MRPTRDSRFIRLLLSLFFLIAIGYAIYEAQGLVYGPEIHPDTVTYSQESFVTIQGTAERITELRLNGTTISVTESGNFSEPYLLAPGANRIILEARDARGRNVRETLDIVYDAPADAIPTRTPADTASTATSSPTTTSARDAE